MSSRPDLFDYSERYPHAPAERDDAASRKAAEIIKGRAATLRERVMQCLRARGEMTPDACADYLGEDILSIRPRFSELRAMSLVAKTGRYGKSSRGTTQNIFRAIGEAHGRREDPPSAD